MHHANRVAIVCSLLLLICIAIAYASQSEKSATRDSLSQRVSNYKDTGHDFSITLGHLSQKYRIPMGIDLERPPTRQFISVRVSHGTVADVLNAIVEGEPGYRWTAINGVVNVVPQQSTNSILDLQIAHFHVRHADPLDLHTAILALPEIKRWLEQNHLKERGVFGPNILVGKNGMTSLPHVSLDLRDVTLRAIMNRIATSPGLGGWIVSRWGEKNQYLNLQIG